MTPAPVTACNACAHCKLLGWRPGRDVQSVSYWCDVIQGHSGSQTECPDYEPGDPWEKIRNEESEWKRGKA